MSSVTTWGQPKQQEQGTGGALLRWLQKNRCAGRKRLKQQELTSILQTLSTLLENGVSLPKALVTIAREPSLRRHRNLLEDIRRGIESGIHFSDALAAHPEAFSSLMVNQIRVGERSGTMAETLRQISAQLEKMNGLRSLVIKKLSYPMVLLGMGGAVICFMLVFVVPVFEKTYADAGVPLPGVTQLLIDVGSLASTYYWLVGLLGAAAVIATVQMRRHPAAALRMDQCVLRIPLLGTWIRDLAVLQLMDVLGNLLDSGYKLAEALRICAGGVSNRMIQSSVISLEAAVNRGERFSHELERQADIFPPIVSQLVIIGEQTGNLSKATADIRLHLRREIERKTNAMVATIEPVLTLGLAGAVGTILLAIYLPMFDMINAVTQ